MAQAEDKVLPEEEESLLEKILLANRGVSFGHKGPTGLAEDKCLLDQIK